MASGTYVAFERVRIGIESVICEIVDNSLDKKSKDVHIIFKRDSKNIEIERDLPHHKTRKKNCTNSFSISVYDNGTGFKTKDDLHNAFELVQEPGKEKKRAAGDTGKFHIGMKEAALSRFHHFSMFAKIGSNIITRSIVFPGKQNSCVYDWERGKVHSNPSDKVPKHVKIADVEKYMSSNSFTTCAHMTAYRKGKHHTKTEKRDFINLDEFIIHIIQYLGIVYEGELLKKTTKIMVGTKKSDLKEVKPVDLFWSQTTPKKIRGLPKKQPKLSKGQKYYCETIHGFGTVEGERKKCKVKIEGKEIKFYFTPYKIPGDHIRKLIREISPNWGGSDLMLDNPPDISESGNLFKAELLQGFSFYRNGRAIVIGNCSEADNDGFYNGIQPSLPTSNAKTTIRFKIEYDSDEYTDYAFSLRPNKDGYVSIDPAVWEAIDLAIGNQIDGVKEGCFEPDNRKAPFYRRQQKKHDRFWEPTPDKRYEKSKKRCSISTCRSYHPPNIVCPKKPCDICGKELYGSKCTASKCDHKCGKCGKKGHLEINCPKLNCKKCKTNPCSGCCGDCKELQTKCTCLCVKCKSPKLPKCTCPPTPPPPPVPFLVSKDPIHGDYFSVDYYPSDKQGCIDLINKIKSKAGIKKKDLKSP